MGYTDRIIHLDFSELVDGGECWVDMKNPALLPQEALVPRKIAVNPKTGEPVNELLSRQVMREMLVRLVDQWKIFDEDGNEIRNPREDNGIHLGDIANSVPMFVINRLSKELTSRLDLD